MLFVLRFIAGLTTLCILHATPLVAQEAAALPAFVDQRTEAGVDFKHHANPTSDKYLVETMGGGVALLDYDHDGRLDIFFVNSGSFAKSDVGVAVDRAEPAIGIGCIETKEPADSRTLPSLPICRHGRQASTEWASLRATTITTA